jgi:transcriptional regulator with XRE-family HTH domain
MDASINQRIKKVRAALRLNQREFSKLLSLSGGYIAGIEAEVRKVNGRLIKLIVSEFGVNEEWLVAGTGEMFSTPDLNGKSSRLVSLFNDLPPKQQDVVFGVIDLLRKTKDTD